MPFSYFPLTCDAKQPFFSQMAACVLFLACPWLNNKDVLSNVLASHLGSSHSHPRCCNLVAAAALPDLLILWETVEGKEARLDGSF